jgi:hypothetical protein
MVAKIVIWQGDGFLYGESGKIQVGSSSPKREAPKKIADKLRQTLHDSRTALQPSYRRSQVEAKRGKQHLRRRGSRLQREGIAIRTWISVHWCRGLEGYRKGFEVEVVGENEDTFEG